MPKCSEDGFYRSISMFQYLPQNKTATGKLRFMTFTTSLSYRCTYAKLLKNGRVVFEMKNERQTDDHGRRQMSIGYLNNSGGKKYLSHMDTSPLPENSCRIKVDARHLRSFSSEQSLPSHTYCHTRARLLWSHLKDHAVLSSLITNKGFSGPIPTQTPNDNSERRTIISHAKICNATSF